MADVGGVTKMDIDLPPIPWSTFAWRHYGGCHPPRGDYNRRNANILSSHNSKSILELSIINLMADNGGVTNMDIDRPLIPWSTIAWLQCGGCYLPKPDLLKPRGEDAHFFLLDKKAIGVADGVGSWSQKGVDSGKYARELISQCAAAIGRQPEDDINPRNVLIEAFHNTSKIRGSSTACLVAVRNDFSLHAANVGDSGFMIFRNNSLFYRSPIQQYRFNSPFQLGGSGPFDNPHSVMELQVPVMANDIIVVATDGLFDNVFPSEIEDLLRSFSTSNVCLWWNRRFWHFQYQT